MTQLINSESMTFDDRHVSIDDYLTQKTPSNESWANTCFRSWFEQQDFMQ